MRTTIYWTRQRGRRAAYALYLRGTCWWLKQQVELLGWRLRLEALVLPVQPDTPPSSVRWPCAMRPMLYSNVRERPVL